MSSRNRLMPVLFCLIFMLVGMVPLVLGIHGVLEARGTLAWPITEGRIERSVVRSEQSKWRDDQRRQRTTTYHYADVTYQYEVRGEPYTGSRITWSDGQSGSEADAEATVSKYPAGTSVVVAYNPDAPEQAILEPGNWGNSGWLLLFGGLFLGLPGLMASGMLRNPPAANEADKTQGRTLHGLVFKERILEWIPGKRIHLHRDHETLLTTIIGSVFAGLLFGLFVTIFLAGFFFSHFGLTFVVKAYLAISAVLAVVFGIWFGFAHRRRDTIIDWGSRTVRAQVGWRIKEVAFDQIEALVYRAPQMQQKGSTGKFTAQVQLVLEGQNYVILETASDSKTKVPRRDKLSQILEPLSAALGVSWSEQA